MIDRLLKNQNPLENRNNLRSSSPHPVVGRRPGNRAAILRPKFVDAGAMAVPIASVRFGHSTTRRRGARRPPPREDPAQAAITGSRPTAAPVFEFHRHEARDRDGEIEWPDNRLQIGKAAREQIERHDVA